MNKTELIEEVANRTGLKKTEAGNVIDSFLQIVEQTLQAGDRLQVTGFGTFELRDRAARTGHNPRTGEAVRIPPAKTIVFKPGKSLKDSMND